MSTPELSIVLPCYNEGANIPLVVERYSKFRTKVNFELILVNNGSTDNSATVMDKLSQKYLFIRVVTINRNIGYGHGIMEGIKVAKADAIAYSHADMQTPPEDVIKGYELFKESGSDLKKVIVKGQRISRREGEKFLSKALEKVVQFVVGYKMTDINGQPKLFSRDFLRSFDSPPLDFSFDVYVMCLAKAKGLKLVTFPVEFGLRIHGESKWAKNILSKYNNIIRQLYNIILIRWKIRTLG